MIAVDWGTSSLRGALLDEEGRVREEKSLARGILSVAPGEFRDVFDRAFGHWLAEASIALVCGMAGSRQGWIEAPYCHCPAGFAEMASQLAWIEPGRIAIVPGLSAEHHGVPDVMRGEETQVLGALRMLQLEDALMVLPGTHSKWVTVEQGRVRSFATFMTGEMYALLSQHSILSRSLPAAGDLLDEGAFLEGVSHAQASGSLLASAFSVRTLALFDRMPQPALPSYLSGLLVGEELRVRNLARGTHVVVVGAPELTRRYALAMSALGAHASPCAGTQAAWLGLWSLARTLGT